MPHALDRPVLARVIFPRSTARSEFESVNATHERQTAVKEFPRNNEKDNELRRILGLHF